MADVQRVGGVPPTDFSTPKIRRIEPPDQTQEIQDRIDLSTRSVKAAEVAHYAELAKAGPDLRPEVVDQAKERVSTGAYLEEKVTRAVAEKVAESLG